MNALKKYPRKFFEKNTETIAKELIGSYLVRDTPNGKIIGKIIETEAYLGANDKACHTYNYRKTERTKIMYQQPGTWYVYLIYGMYHCLNVITEPMGEYPERLPEKPLIGAILTATGKRIIQRAKKYSHLYND